jgi:asparagine synthase (glutamine-hydrolysing)
VCGIAGFLSSQNKGQFLESAIAKLVHRGPDEKIQQLFENGDKTCGLGMTRLAIVDVAEGHQPYFNEERNIAVVFNGEIYNHHNLRRKLEKLGHRFESSADGEVISHLYEEYGLGFVNELDGMFAIAIWDFRRRKIIAARDRFGKKPLFFFQKNGEFLFASELKSIRELIGRNSLNVREESLHELMNIGFIRAPRTIYEEIRQLRPGELVESDGDSLEFKKYWLPVTQRPEQARHKPPSLGEIKMAIEIAVKKRIPTEVEFGIFLSGGIDSSLVAAFASKMHSKTLPSFSVAFEDERLDETSLASETGKKLGLDHRILRFSEKDSQRIWIELPEVFDSPNLDSSIFPMLFLSAEAAKEVKVIFTGDGGDELFGGYEKYQLMLRLLRFGPLANRVPVTGILKGRVRAIERAKVLLEASTRGVWELSREINTQYLREGELGNFPKLVVEPIQLTNSKSNQILDADLEFYLPGILQKVDSGTMWNSIEARSPLLDKDLYELSRTLDLKSQFGPKGTKLALRAIGRSLLPPTVNRAPKRGFSPNRSKLLKTGLEMGLGNAFDKSESKVVDILGLELSKSNWEMLKVNKEMERVVWALVVIEQWLERWT